MASGRDPVLRFVVALGKGHQDTDPPHPLARLLRACQERPRCGRTADQRDELSPSHELPSDEAHNLAHHCTMRASWAALGQVSYRCERQRGSS